MGDNHRIKVKIGNAEFEAEGGAEDVKAQYEAFLALLKSSPSTHSPPTTRDPEQERPDAASLDDALLSRVFQTGKDGVVSLKVLPRSEQREADALLLLLFGYRRIQKVDNVFGTQLAKAARASGIGVERIDRTLDTHASLFIRGGRRRGAKYTLNNQGVAAAERLVRKIFD
jgi:hypothetical protein